LVPFGVEAVMVRLEEQVRTIGIEDGGLTVTENEQFVLSPQESLAVVFTVVVPIEKVLPLGGADWRFNGELHPPEADVLKCTMATPAALAVTVKLDEQFNAIGGIDAATVTLAVAIILA